MVIYPQFDPVALQIGPFAIHWYGVMYLLAFTQFLLLGRLRIRMPQYQALGWTYKDLEAIQIVSDCMDVLGVAIVSIGSIVANHG